MNLQQIKENIQIEEYYYTANAEVEVTYYDERWHHERPCETIYIPLDMVIQQIENMGYKVGYFKGELEVNTGDDRFPFDVWMEGINLNDVREMMELYFVTEKSAI